MYGKQVTNYLFTVEDINKILEKYTDIYIYGAGEYGKRTADYIIAISKQNLVKGFLVSNKKNENEIYKGLEISEARTILTNGKGFIIIAVSLLYLSEVSEIVRKSGWGYACVTDKLFMQMASKLSVDLKDKASYQGLDFMLAGFSKCGITSIHRALLDIQDVYVSDKKESRLFEWYHTIDNPIDRLIREYFNSIKKGQFVGMIEPVFARYPDQIQEIFGNDFKVIFIVRNPVDAVFSRFKMFNRSGFQGMKEAYEKVGGGTYKAAVFDEFFLANKHEPFAQYSKYVDWIKLFLKHFSKEKIKIVIFEEMIKEPKKILNDMLCFIGSSSRYDYEKLPIVNEGNFVMSNLKSLEIAKEYHDINLEYRYGEKSNMNRVYHDYLKIKKEYESADKIFNVKLLEKQRQKLEEFYYESVRNLENLMNKDLSDIWF